MTSVAQRSFASGELAPPLWPRTDAQRYGAGLRTLRNFTVTEIGGARSRAGFMYVGTVAGLAEVQEPMRLIPWVRSSALPYLLELGIRTLNAYIRPWLNGQRVTVGTPAAWLTATAYTAGKVVEAGGFNYYCTTAHTSGASTEPGTGASWQTVWYILEDDILEIPLPYTDSELPEVQVADDGATIRMFAHANHATRQLEFVSSTEWALTTVSWAVEVALAAPANPAIANPGAGSAATFTQYKVAALQGTTEGATSTAVGWNKRPGNFVNPALPSAGDTAPLDFSWDAVVGATGYRVFRSYDSGPYYKVIDVSGVTNYRDIGAISQAGLTQEPSSTGAVEIVSLDAADEYPGVVAGFQQRLLVAGRTTALDEVFASRAGSFRDFTFRSPIVDDDALGWRQAATRLNRIHHLVEMMGQLISFSDIGEGVVTGDTDRILRPGEANPTQSLFNGAAKIPQPLNVNGALLYVQARGTVVRDLVLSGNGLESANISATAQHLLRGYTITSWTFQQTPHPTIWIVRSDGALLSLTYSRQEQVLAWAQHDSTGGPLDGTDDAVFLSVACVPEGSVDVVYALVSRATGKFLERMTDRDAASWLTRVHVDSAATTFTVAVPTAAEEVITDAVTFSGNGASLSAPRLEEASGTSVHNGSFEFVSGRFTRSRYEFEAYLEADERSKMLVVLTMNGGDYFTFTIDLALGTISTASSGATASALYTVTTATLTANGAGYDLVLRVDPSTAYIGTDYSLASLRCALHLMDGANTVYAGTAGFGLVCDIAVNRVVTDLPNRLEGLTHLEGLSVSLLGDNVVLASPATALRLVTSGTVILTQNEWDTYSDYVVGLPITVDLETLDIDTVDGRSLKEKAINISRLGVWVEESRTLWAGPQAPVASLLDGMARITVDDASQTPLTDTEGTGYIEGNLLGRFAKSGRTFIRHVDPLPLTVLAVMPQGKIGG